MQDIFVELPDGTREFMPANSKLSFANKDVYVIDEIHPFVAEAVAFGIETPDQLDLYMGNRRQIDEDGAFILTAYECVLKERNIKDLPNHPTRVRETPDECKVSGHFPTQLAYFRMRDDGESHRMSEMLATRSFPGIKTDAIFNEGRFSGEAGRIGVEQRWLQEKAEAVGVSTTGKFYCRGLADFPGDPAAWVSDRGDVLRVAREKNMTVHGYVEHEGREVEPTADVRIADDLVESEVNEILAECPEANREQVREEVFAVRTGGVDPNDLRVGDYDESYLQPEA